MKAGLIAHSTETVATTAVTAAGTAATRENSEMRRVCSRDAGARGAPRPAQPQQLDDDQRQNERDDQRVAAEQREHHFGRRPDRGEPGEDDESREREHETRSHRDGAETA